MKPEEARLLRGLLTEQRVLSLAVLIRDEPYASLLPFAAGPAYDHLLVHASDLARHTRGLVPDGRFGALIHRPDHADADPLQLTRVSLQGAIQRITKGTAEYAAAAATYQAKFPTSIQTFRLGDFNLYRLELEKGRLIMGFARTVNLSPKAFAEVRQVPD